MCNKFIWVLCLCLLLGWPVSVQAEEVPAAPTLRVGWYQVDGLQNIDAIHGQYSGYNYEYLKAIAQFTGWHYKFVPGTFAECMEWLQSGQIDLVGGLARIPEREGILAYPRHNCGYAGPRLVTEIGNQQYAFDDVSAFNHIRAGLLDSANLQERWADYAAYSGFTPRTFLYATQTVQQQALQEHEVDALLLNGMRSLHQMRILAQLPKQEVFFVTTPDKLWIRDGLDRALAQIEFFDNRFSENLYQKYFSDDNYLSVAFTQAERAYLARRKRAENPVLVVYDPACLPIEYRDPKTGEMSGIMKHIFALLEEKTGLQFQFVTAQSYDAATKQYADQAEVYATMNCDFDWGELHNAYVTQPIFDVQIFMVYNQSMMNYNTIALPRGYHLSQTVQAMTREDQGAVRNRQNIQYVYYDTMAECLEAVRNNQAGRTYFNAYELSYYMDMLRSEPFAMQSISGFTERTSIGVSKKADPLLFSILCRSLRSISKNEINEIILSESTARRPVGMREFIYTNPVQSMGILSVLLVLLGGVLFFYYSNRSNRRQRLALEAASRAKSEFLSRVSHDIRTPMNAIMGMTELAGQKNTSPDVEACLQKIRISNQFLLELINDILDMSMIESGKLILHPEPYRMADFADLLQGMIQPLAGHKQIRFVCDIDASLQGILVDKLRFNRIFLNLLSNAIKFTPENGTVALSLAELSSDSDSDSDGDGLWLRGVVWDTGIGIKPEFLPKLFEPFTQENEKHIKATEGSGLGLAIVKRFVGAMDGSIRVESEPGKGTVFTVDLCVQRYTADMEEEQRPKPEDEAEVLRGRRVLVVEDNEINQEVACQLLVYFGMECEVADNGQMALDVFQSKPEGWYDVILMDIRMPVMDGLEATQRLRALPRQDAPVIPVIALTADAYVDARRQILENGMTEYVAKPVQPAALVHVLAQVLLDPGAGKGRG